MTKTTQMRREIAEIPDAAARLLDASGGALTAAGKHLRDLSPRFLTTVARGSSDHAASFLKYAVELSAGVPVASLGPSIASIYGAKLRLRGSACISRLAIGQEPRHRGHGRRRAGRRGADHRADQHRRIAAGCEPSDHAIDIMAGAETSVAATKSFVNSALAGLLLLAHWTDDEELLAALHRLPAHFQDAIDCDWMEIGAALSGETSLFILGRGPSTAIAAEAALKFKETCSMHAEAYSAAEVMHGPLALVGPGFPVLALAARDASEASIAAAADTLAGKGAAAFITSRLSKQAAMLPHAATGHPLTDPLALIVSFYAFVEAFAVRLGLNPDQPPNLRKVTETL